MPLDWINALIGGVFIGLAASLMLYWNGRVAGISGIVSGVLNPVTDSGGKSWRWMFLLGFGLGGLILKVLKPEVFASELPTPLWTVPAAGMLVGVGTMMSGGCTSGHGVCGISRLSIRSIFATIVFIAAGILSVLLARHWGVMS
ncbi:MAG: YeeE/YedE family protein [Chitinophagaceae bacterium]|nr:YeeE/YedE family protein [Oligoflexus sp.]